MSITTDTRFESYEKLNKRRYLKNEIVKVLKYSAGMTAREIATVLHSNGTTLNNERQATAPRLTEMVDAGVVEVVGKKWDDITQRNVAVYALKK